MQLKVKKLDSRALLPGFGSPAAAGADLYALTESDVVIKSNESVFIHTGIALEIPDGYAGLIYARSGLACKSGLAPANKVGVIDSDYRGEIIVCLRNHSSENRVVRNGDRIAQLVITHLPAVEYVEVADLNESERGDGGFGSTGK